MKIIFFDENNNEIEQTDILDTYNAYWTLMMSEHQIPEETHSIKTVLMGTRYAGDDNDSYFDNLSIKIWQEQSCLGLIGDLNDDNLINIQDIILMIDLILNNSYDLFADINEDNMVNVQDVILLVNVILNN